MRQPDLGCSKRDFFRRSGIVMAMVAVSTLVVGVLPTAAYGQTPNPFSTAAEHAGMAAEAEDLTEIHQHLQHVLNCLEGSTGQDYRKVPGNPCAGKGALQTLPRDSANRVRAQKAIALARVGVTVHDVPPAHYVAQAVHAILTEDQQQ